MLLVDDTLFLQSVLHNQKVNMVIVSVSYDCYMAYGNTVSMFTNMM